VGQPLSKGNVCLRFSLLNGQGGLDYEETQSVTTDEYGLVNVAIGAGAQAQASNSTGVYKSFDSIVWTSSVKSLKVSVSYDGCSSFKQVSSQALNYTPYALYAEAVDYKNVREAPTKLSQFSNDAGYLIAKDLDPLKSEIQTNSSKIEVANKSIADNKQASDAAFLIVNQSITSLNTQVAQNTGSISNINTKITDQQNQISDNRNQIAATNNNLNTQIGGLQGQLNTTNSAVNNLYSIVEMQSNKSLNVLADGNDNTKYPSVKAVKDFVDLAVNGKALVADLAGKANLASPEFTGTPKAPTPASSDNSTQIATTAFVKEAMASIVLQSSLATKAYTSILIGTQQWMQQNLEVVTYRDGTIIPQVTDYKIWKELTTGAWCYYNNDPSSGYGKLYNWYAVNDARGLAPQGWHIPTDAEWTTLSTLLGGISVAGGKMKTTGTTRWNSPNAFATNESGFAGLPGGYRSDIGNFTPGWGYWWSATEHSSTYAWKYRLTYGDGILYRGYLDKRFGFSVRCIKD
jgi:uncharacterized protein (TIGR02145 family)